MAVVDPSSRQVAILQVRDDGADRWRYSLRPRDEVVSDLDNDEIHWILAEGAPVRVLPVDEGDEGTATLRRQPDRNANPSLVSNRAIRHDARGELHGLSREPRCREL